MISYWFPMCHLLVACDYILVYCIFACLFLYIHNSGQQLHVFLYINNSSHCILVPVCPLLVVNDSILISFLYNILNKWPTLAIIHCLHTDHRSVAGCLYVPNWWSVISYRLHIRSLLVVTHDIYVTLCT